MNKVDARDLLPIEAQETARTAEQIVTVRCLGGSKADLSYFKKAAGNWKRIFSCGADIGKAGPGKTREGDMKTPLGAFSLSTAFGIRPDPSPDDPYGRRAEGYLQVTEAHYWCGQSGPYYNRLIDNDAPPEGYAPSGDDEHLIRYAPSYHYGLFIGYNEAGADGLGSAIFLHCKGKNPYTAGCVAIDEDLMRELVLELKSGAKIVIYE